MSTRRPRSPLWGCAVGSVMVTIPTGKASVSDEQLLQRQPDLPCRLVDRDQAVAACACSDAIQPARRRNKDGPPPGPRPIDVGGSRRASAAPTSQRDRLSGRPPLSGGPRSS